MKILLVLLFGITITSCNQELTPEEFIVSMFQAAKDNDKITLSAMLDDYLNGSSGYEKEKVIDKLIIGMQDREVPKEHQIEYYGSGDYRYYDKTVVNGKTLRVNLYLDLNKGEYKITNMDVYLGQPFEKVFGVQ